MKSSEDTRILIIDDNEDIVLMLRAMLNLRGYNSDVRTNVLNLEEHLRETAPHLILMDMLLSGADGREVCKKLKDNGEFSSIPILMISAHPTAKEDCLAAGANYFLAKPFDMHNLFETVHEALK